MKHLLTKLIRRSAGAGLICLLALSFGSPAARAGLTVDIHLYHDNYGYYFYPWLNANTNAPGFPDGNYLIASPQSPTNGSSLQYQATNNTLGYATGGGNYYYDFNSFLYGITNGQWSIWVTNSISTNQYQFTVTVTGVTSNAFDVPALAVFPTNNAAFVTSQPLFQWTGPANWAGTLNVSDNFIDTKGNYNSEASASLPPNQTSWPCPVVLPDGANDFNADYTSNVTAQIVASTPLNNASQPISAWISTATLETSCNSQFNVFQPTNQSGGHTILAHYAFDNSSSLGQDSSGNGNDMAGETFWGAQHQSDTNAEAGAGAVRFFGTDAMFAYAPALSNLKAVLAGSFSFSTWVKTTVTNGVDSNDAFYGAVIFWAYNDQGNTNDTIPLAITGSKAAFSTRDHLGTTTTLHSLTSVNDGNYHLITVTRNQSDGEKKIYVDGNFESSEFGTTDPLNGDNYNLTIGGWAYIIASTSTVTNYSSYQGLLDDLQVYSGVLSSNDVAYLYQHPGTNVANVSAISAELNAALGTTNLNWATSGDTSWFLETANTYNGAPSAAQSGSVTYGQSSTLSATVTGPGTLTFYWSSIANDTNGGFSCEFDVDGNYSNNITGNTAWYHDGPYSIGAGQHTLSWTAHANGDSDPTQAGYLNQVNWTTGLFVQATASPTNGAAPLTVNFTAAAVDSLGNAITNWSWNFGDATTSSLQNPAHTYTTAGTFSPTLSTINALGTAPTTLGLDLITAWSIVKATANPTHGESPLTVQFTAPTVDSSGYALTNWSWNFGDGTVSSAQNPAHTYTTVGTFSPTLSTINTNGAVPVTIGPGLITATIAYSNIVKATASPTVGKAPLTVQFNSPAVDSRGKAITKWSWSFSDGTVSSVQNPSHTYNNVGSFKPTLTTLNGSGQTPLTVGPGVITATQHSPTNVVKNLPGSPVGFTYHNFSNTKSLQFLGNATNVTTSDGAVLQLTPSASGQAGAAYTAVPIPFGPHVGFSTFFTFRLSKPGGLVDSDGVQGADGIAFLIQSVGYAYGTGGGGIGYEGIGNSLAVEFDTWNNYTQNGTPGDINGNHVAVNFNGVLNDPVSVSITNAMNNGNIWYAWIDYEGVSQDLEVRLSEIPVRPLAPTLDTTVDLPAILGTTNAFVGFTASTGGAWNEQDILAWKFMALPTTRFTGTFNATNLPPGLKINKGIVLARHRYVVAGVIYTNYTYVPVTTVSNANAQIAFASGIAELNPASALPNPNAIDIALSNNAAALDAADFMDFAMLAAYTNSGSGGEGAVINYNNPDYIAFAPYYANAGFPPFNMNEPTYNTLQDQMAANPPPGLNPPSALTQLQINSQTFPGPYSPQWISMDTGGGIQGNSVGYSLGTYLGTMTARQQVVASPPLPLIIFSPRSDGTNFVFDFGTVSNQSYTVWANANLATLNWISYTNLIGDGYFQEITIPLTNTPQNFFQLSSP